MSENPSQPAAPPAVGLPKPNISGIKNKKRRTEKFLEMKAAQKKEKLKARKVQKKEAQRLGDAAPPKKIPKTIENMRVADETMVGKDGEDEEVAFDEATDEMAPHFSGEVTPKVLITTCDRPCSRTRKFVKELKKVLPTSEIPRRDRRGLDLKNIIKSAVDRGFTALLVLNEDRKEPNGLVVSRLPDGPTAHFKLSSVRLSTEIKNCGEPTGHCPELIMNNFNTRLGRSVGRLLASLFPVAPEFNGRRVATFHNQRDFIYFRHHRYQFRSLKKVSKQELGPRFTLKLRSLQKGAFDSKFGEFEFVHKRHEMESNRRKFVL